MRESTPSVCATSFAESPDCVIPLAPAVITDQVSPSNGRDVVVAPFFTYPVARTTIVSPIAVIVVSFAVRNAMPEITDFTDFATGEITKRGSNMFSVTFAMPGCFATNVRCRNLALSDAPSPRTVVSFTVHV